MTLTNEQTLKEVEAVHARKPLYSHPLWVAFAEGKLTLPQVRECIKQRGIIPLHNHNYHGRLYVACPDPKWRARIAEVCYEEGTGRLYADGVSHHELYLRLAKALGISRREMYETNYCAGALAFKAYFSDVCGRDFLEGVSAHMLAAETPGPRHGKKRNNALRVHYGLSKTDVLFSTVHEVADIDHSNIGFELLEEFAKTEADRRRVIRTVEETLDMMLFMYDDIYRVVRAVKN